MPPGKKRLGLAPYVKADDQSSIPKIWYSAPLSLQRCYVLCLVGAERLFRGQVVMIRHAQPDQYYNDLLEGRSDGTRAVAPAPRRGCRGGRELALDVLDAETQRAEVPPAPAAPVRAPRHPRDGLGIEHEGNDGIENEGDHGEMGSGGNVEAEGIGDDNGNC